MRLAAPGDAVLSFAGGFIRHAGIVRDFAVPSPKPEDFDAVGEYWNLDGWLLSVEWQALDQPVRPKDRIVELAPLLPKKYSPIHAVSGNGNQKAYLAEIGRSVFELLAGLINFESNPTPHAETAAQLVLNGIDDNVEASIKENLSLDSTTKQQLILARYGQGVFRTRVSQFEKVCRLTNVENPRLLIASHIKPWRLCANAGERLDGANGLLLTPHVDRLFDRGLVSFSDNGAVIISSHLDRADLERLGLLQACAKNCGPFDSRQATYLAFHRETVFLP